MSEIGSDSESGLGSDGASELLMVAGSEDVEHTHMTIWAANPCLHMAKKST
jgi:hypothetical protein